jgi:hypothetical protein
MTLPEFLQRGSRGEIRLTGHRIDLYHVVTLYRDGYTVAMIDDYHPDLGPDLIARVIGFYDANRADVDRYVRELDAEYDRLAALPQPGPSLDELRRRLAARRSAESA